MRRYRLMYPILCMLLLAWTSIASASDATSGEDALKWWIDRAEHGGPNAQYSLGQMYATGNPALGLQPDVAQAAAWYRRAADGGYAEAQFALGQMYEDGTGVKRDEATALAWYRKAADQGHPLAKEKIRAAEAAAATPGAPAPAAKQSLMSVVTSALLVNRSSFWDWWQGALALAFITLAFWWVMRTPLGVSSSWDRIVHWREEEAYAQRERAMFERRDELKDVMLAETIAQFGKEAVAKMLAQQRQEAAQTSKARAAERRKIPWQAHVTFLAMMLIGGLLASVMRGDFHLQLGLGADFARLFGHGPHIWALLLGGGFLVGFGTRMAGGCTSGHGLSGCSRLQPGSLVSTAAFFGTAVLTSLILEKLV
jgi:TPR repeat protein